MQTPLVRRRVGPGPESGTAHGFMRGLKGIWRGRWGYYFILPCLAVWTVFFIVPIVQAVFMSFTEWRPTGSTWVGLDNYVATLKDPIFLVAMRNTVLFSAVVVVATIALALALSVLIFPLPGRAQAFFKGAFYLPAVISTAVVAMLWLWLYNPPFGLFNYILWLFGMEPVAWLGGTNTALPSIMVMSIWSDFGTAIILLTAGMASIPPDLYDAATVDGAGGWSRFWKITLPLLKPVLLFLGVMNTVKAFQVFTPVWLLTRGGPANHTTTVAYHIYITAFNFLKLGLASAQSVLLFLAILVFSAFQFKLLGAQVEY
jgi:multiple sugar transport system permease protein